mmetsp:Transcript_6324/g.10144  ORF Transcript_6324/g.10144 Transcript_6324/m.10144 type:complete len:400 (+) Transcript_6324:92-1291(+)
MKLTDKELWRATEKDFIPNDACGGCVCICCCIVNFVLMIMFFPCTLTQLGQFKFGLLRNKVTGVVDLENTYAPGWYWIGFWKEFVEFPSTLNTIEFSEEPVEEGVQDLRHLRSRDKDGKLIFLDVSIQYLLHKESIGKLYTDMLTFYEDIMISELRDQIAKAANGFAVQDIWSQYNSVVDLMKERCDIALQLRHAECWGLQLWGVKLSTEYEAKLVETQVRKQAQRTAEEEKKYEAVRAATRVLVAEYNKEIQIVKAGGEADVYSIKTLAASTASANIIAAQAKSLQIIKDRVCLSHGKVDNTSDTCKSTGPGVMSARHMVEYEKQVLLKHLKDTELVLNHKGGQHPEAMNIESSRKIMNGQARRLLLHQRQDLGGVEGYFDENPEDFNDNPLTTPNEL